MTTRPGFSTNETLPPPGGEDDRALSAFRSLVRKAFPQLGLLGVWDYRIDTIASETTVVASPVDKDLGLPGGLLVTLTPSHLGERVTPTVGARIVVEFLDCNAGKAISRSGDPDANPFTAKIFGGTLGVARDTDPVAVGTLQVLPGGGVPTLTFTPAGGSPGVASPTVTLTAKISGGSLKLKAG